MRKLVGALAGLFALTLTAAASASSAGISGFSGKTAGSSCTMTGCHSGGAAPTVAIDGPATLAAGAQGSYTFTVTTALAKSGADIAASDGATLAAGTGLKIMSGELVQSSPLATASGAAKYTFTVTAPTSGTTMTLYAAGLAADGTGGTTGDGQAQTTLAVTVTGGGAAPAASSSASTSTGDDDDSTTTKSKSTSTASPTDPWNDTQSCSASRGPSTGGIVAATFVVLGLVATKRRRQK